MGMIMGLSYVQKGKSCRTRLSKQRATVQLTEEGQDKQQAVFQQKIANFHTTLWEVLSDRDRRRETVSRDNVTVQYSLCLDRSRK